MKNRSLAAQRGLGARAIPARHLRQLVHRLIQLGFDVEPPLVAAGLSVAALDHPQARVERQQLSLALQGLAKATGRSDLGFELGSLISIATADVIGQLLLSSPTLAEGLARTSRYFALLTPSYRLQVEASPTTYRLQCEPTEPLPYDVALIGLEILAVGLHRMVTFLTQEKSVPAKLAVSWPPPAHAARYRELRGLQVRFGASERPRFVMELAAAQVEAPLPMANPLAVKDIEETCRRMLDDVSRARSWKAWVTAMLRGVEGHFPSQAEVAAMLSISGRTLARGLEAEGCAYRALASGIRHERARELLRDTNLPLADIADRLGYSDAANFSRAYRKLEGCSPGDHRHALRSRTRAPRQP